MTDTVNDLMLKMLKEIRANTRDINRDCEDLLCSNLWTREGVYAISDTGLRIEQQLLELRGSLGRLYDRLCVMDL